MLGAKLPVTSGAAVVGSGGSREGGNEKNATEALSADRNRKRRKPSKQAPAAQTASDGAALREASQPRSRKSVDALQKEPSLMPKPSKQQGVAARGGSKKPAEMAHSSVASADWKRPGKTVAKSSGTQQANVQLSVQGASTSAAGGSGASCSLGDAAVCRFPMHALTAINDVLFGRHGYRRMDLHGDPRQVRGSSIHRTLLMSPHTLPVTCASGQHQSLLPLTAPTPIPCSPLLWGLSRMTQAVSRGASGNMPEGPVLRTDSSSAPRLHFRTQTALRLSPHACAGTRS